MRFTVVDLKPVYRIISSPDLEGIELKGNLLRGEQRVLSLVAVLYINIMKNNGELREALENRDVHPFNGNGCIELLIGLPDELLDDPVLVQKN